MLLKSSQLSTFYLTGFLPFLISCPSLTFSRLSRPLHPGAIQFRIIDEKNVDNAGYLATLRESRSSYLLLQSCSTALAIPFSFPASLSLPLPLRLSLITYRSSPFPSPSVHSLPSPLHSFPFPSPFAHLPTFPLPFTPLPPPFICPSFTCDFPSSGFPFPVTASPPPPSLRILPSGRGCPLRIPRDS